MHKVSNARGIQILDVVLEIVSFVRRDRERDLHDFAGVNANFFKYNHYKNFTTFLLIKTQSLFIALILFRSSKLFKCFEEKQI